MIELFGHKSINLKTTKVPLLATMLSLTSSEGWSRIVRDMCLSATQATMWISQSARKHAQCSTTQPCKTHIHSNDNLGLAKAVPHDEP